MVTLYLHVLALVLHQSATQQRLQQRIKKVTGVTQAKRNMFNHHSKQMPSMSHLPNTPTL